MTIPASGYIGREQDLAALTAHVRTAAEGRGCLMLLSGEPGIGKTRTCEELARRAEHNGMSVLWGRCWDVGAAPAYWPWTQVLQSLIAAVPPNVADVCLAGHRGRIAPLLSDAADDSAGVAPPDSASGRFEIFRAVSTILERAARLKPLLIILDDLHGADDASLLVLEFLGRQLAGMPIIVVAAYRDVPRTSGAPLSTRLPDLLRQPSAQSLMVRPLDVVETEALAERITGQKLSVSVTLTLHSLTDGNPLFLLECLRAVRLEDNLPDLAAGRIPLPVGLRSAISRHLAPLSPDCRSILRAAAVLGREFNIVTLRRLIHYPDDVLLTALLDEGVITEVLTADATMAGRYRFVHTLVREALYAELSGVEQLRYHHDAATVLSSFPGRESQLAQIAHHFVEAARRGAEPRPAAQAARAAGDRALRLFAYDDAERLYSIALDVIEHFGPDDAQLHAEVLLAHGNACNRLGEIGRAKESFERAYDLACAIDSRELLAAAALGYGGPLTFPEGGYVDDAFVAMLERAISAWKGDDHPLLARLLARLATAIYFTPQVERRRELCTRALSMARAGDDADALAQVLLTTHTALWGPNAEERLRIADELVQLVRRTGNRNLGFAAHHWRYCDLLELDDLGGMENELQACRALANELREPAMLGWIDIFRTGRAMWEGRFAECEKLANDNLGLARWLGNAAQTLHFLQMFHLRSLQGRADELLEAMQMIAGLNPGIPAFSIGLAFIHAEAGRLDEARPLAAGVVAQLDQYPPDINYVSTLTCLGLVCARLGDRDLIAPVYERMQPYASLSIMIGTGLGYCGAAAHWLAVMATGLGRFDDAEAYFEQALVRENAIGSPPWIALTQVEYAAMLTARNAAGDRERATALLEQANATAAALGMNGLRERIVALKKQCTLTTAAVAVAPNGSNGTARTSVFRREGDFWTVEHGGQTSRLRDRRGFRYVAQLLRHPYQEFLVLDLAAEGVPIDAIGEPRSMATCAAGSIADKTALAQYRHRLEDLRAELNEAEANNDTHRAVRLREELHSLSSHLGRAVGLGGRQRPASPDLERARSAVTKRIRDALKRIQEENPTLGRHLEQSVQTGYFCTYAPPGKEQIPWSF